MPILISPPTYLSSSSFAASLTGTTAANSDYDLSSYSTAQLDALMVAATGIADSMMRRSLLPEERTKRLYGRGTNRLDLLDAPIIYVRKLQIALPGASGFAIPASQCLIDYETGELLQYSPLTFVGIGYSTIFPTGTPIDVTLATGYNFPIPAPAIARIVDAPATGSLTGQIDLVVTTKTQDGESTAVLQTFTTVSGAVTVKFSPVLGAYSYRLYAAPHGSQMTLVAETPASQYDVVNAGIAPITITFGALTPPTGSVTETFPSVDTTARPFPAGVVEATRLLALQTLAEQNNLANRGIAADRRPDQSGTQWRGTQGSEAKGVSYFTAAAMRLLAPYSLQAIY